MYNVISSITDREIKTESMVTASTFLAREAGIADVRDLSWQDRHSSDGTDRRWEVIGHRWDGSEKMVNGVNQGFSIGEVSEIVEIVRSSKFRFVTVNGSCQIGLEYTEIREGLLCEVRRPIVEETFLGYGLDNGVGQAIVSIGPSTTMSAWRIVQDGVERVVAPPAPGTSPDLHLPDEEHGWTWGDAVNVPSTEASRYYHLGLEITAREAVARLEVYLETSDDNRSVALDSIKTINERLARAEVAAVIAEHPDDIVIGGRGGGGPVVIEAPAVMAERLAHRTALAVGYRREAERYRSIADWCESQQGRRAALDDAQACGRDADRVGREIAGLGEAYAPKRAGSVERGGVGPRASASATPVTTEASHPQRRIARAIHGLIVLLSGSELDAHGTMPDSHRRLIGTLEAHLDTIPARHLHDEAVEAAMEPGWEDRAVEGAKREGVLSPT